MMVGFWRISGDLRISLASGADHDREVLTALDPAPIRAMTGHGSEQPGLGAHDFKAIPGLNFTDCDFDQDEPKSFAHGLWSMGTALTMAKAGSFMKTLKVGKVYLGGFRRSPMLVARLIREVHTNTAPVGPGYWSLLSSRHALLTAKSWTTSLFTHRGAVHSSLY